MSEKKDTGEEVKDPFEAKRKELRGKIETHNYSIQAFRKKIVLIDSLQSIFKLFSDAKVVQPSRFTHGNTLEVSLPNIETLGSFFRELEHLKSKMPNVKLTYSGKVAKDKVLAEVKI